MKKTIIAYPESNVFEDKTEETGIQVIVKDEVDEHLALIDDELVWHGGMNLLGKEGIWDNLTRIKSAAVAEELLELSLGKHVYA